MSKPFGFFTDDEGRVRPLMSNPGKAKRAARRSLSSSQSAMDQILANERRDAREAGDRGFFKGKQQRKSLKKLGTHGPAFAHVNPGKAKRSARRTAHYNEQLRFQARAGSTRALRQGVKGQRELPHFLTEREAMATYARNQRRKHENPSGGKVLGVAALLGLLWCANEAAPVPKKAS